MENMGSGRLPYVNSNLFAMYLHKPLLKLYGITPKEFMSIKRSGSDMINKFKLNIFFDNDRILITPGSRIQAMRPPGLDVDIWRAFVAYLIQEYGYNNIESIIVATLADMIREKVNTYLRIFGIDVKVASFDPSKLDRKLVDKLPKDIRNFIFSGNYLAFDKENKRSDGNNNPDSSPSDSS